MSSTNSVLVVSQILRLFVNILTPDDKYSLSVKARFKSIQIQLSPNQKIFSEDFVAFTESTNNLEYFEQKDHRRKWFLSEIIDWKKRD